MALVGCRTQHDQFFFLLQNWWKSKQFIEVDAVYLKACSAFVTFVTTRQTDIPASFVTGFGKYWELEAVDKSEGVVGEMVVE